MVPFTIDLIQNLGLTILQVINKYYFRGVMYFLIALVNVVLAVVLLNTVGLVGAALSTAVSMFIGNGLIMNWYYGKKVGLDILGFWRQMGKIILPVALLIAAFACAYWTLPTPHESWFSIIVAVAAYAGALAMVLWRFSMNDYEKGLVKRLLRKG